MTQLLKASTLPANQFNTHLNNQENPLRLSLRTNVLQENYSMDNMIANELQFNNGFIIRNTFNNGIHAFQPVNMEEQERAKLERKKLRNRQAAIKCRLKKMERVNLLEQNRKKLKSEIEKLEKILYDSQIQNNNLREQLLQHMNNGCIINKNSGLSQDLNHYGQINNYPELTNQSNVDSQVDMNNGCIINKNSALNQDLNNYAQINNYHELTNHTNLDNLVDMNNGCIINKNSGPNQDLNNYAQINNFHEFTNHAYLDNQVSMNNGNCDWKIYRI